MAKNTEEKPLRLPDAELDIMLVLWKLGRPAKIIDIYDGLAEIRPYKKPTIHTLVERLAEKGFVRVEYEGGAQPYKLITPLIGAEEYREAESVSFVEKFCGGSWQTLIAALVKTNKISEDDLKELNALLRAGGKG